MALGHWLKDYIGPHSGGSGGGSGGGGAEPLIVHGSHDESTDVTTLDKTWQEIYDAMPNVLLLIDSLSKYLIVSVFYSFPSGQYTVIADDTYKATSADGYPATTGEV